MKKMICVVLLLVFSVVLLTGCISPKVVTISGKLINVEYHPKSLGSDEKVICVFDSGESLKINGGDKVDVYGKLFVYIDEFVEITYAEQIMGINHFDSIKILQL